jgi:hypothetical protein
MHITDIPPRAALYTLLLVASPLALHRRPLRPIVASMSAMAAVNIALSDIRVSNDRTRMALWLIAAGAGAALSWAVWRRRGWPAVALAFLAYAAACAWLPPRGWWPAHRHLYEWATRAPFIASALVSLLSWALRKNEGPRMLTQGLPEAASSSSVSSLRSRSEPSVALDPNCRADEAKIDAPGTRFHRGWPCHSPLDSAKRRVAPGPDDHTSSHRSAQACAAILAWSGFLDVTLGALAPGASYSAAAPLAWATWMAIGVVLAREARWGSRA